MFMRRAPEYLTMLTRLDHRHQIFDSLYVGVSMLSDSKQVMRLYC